MREDDELMTKLRMVDTLKFILDQNDRKKHKFVFAGKPNGDDSDGKDYGYFPCSFVAFVAWAKRAWPSFKFAKKYAKGEYIVMIEYAEQ